MSVAGPPRMRGGRSGYRGGFRGDSFRLGSPYPPPPPPFPYPQHPLSDGPPMFMGPPGPMGPPCPPGPMGPPMPFCPTFRGRGFSSRGISFSRGPFRGNRGGRSIRGKRPASNSSFETSDPRKNEETTPKQSKNESEPKKDDDDTITADWIKSYDGPLPQELLDLCKPMHCELCGMVGTSKVHSKTHYDGKSHAFEVYKFLALWAQRNQCLPPNNLKHTNLSEGYRPKKQMKKNSQPQNLYCEVCDINLTSQVHADQHFQGRNHALRVAGMKPIKSGWYFDPVNKTWNQAPKKIDTTAAVAAELSGNMPYTSNAPSAPSTFLVGNSETNDVYGQQNFAEDRFISNFVNNDTCQEQEETQNEAQQEKEVQHQGDSQKNETTLKAINEQEQTKVEAVTTMTPEPVPKPDNVVPIKNNKYSYTGFVQSSTKYELQGPTGVTTGPPAPVVANLPAISSNLIPSNFSKDPGSIPANFVASSNNGPPPKIKVDDTGRSLFVCELCNITTTCQEQLNIHMQGKKHLNRLSGKGIKRDNSKSVVAYNQTPEQMNHKSQSTGQHQVKDIQNYLMPSGSYYCPWCNLSIPHEEGFRQHLGTREHNRHVHGATRGSNRGRGRGGRGKWRGRARQ